MISPKKGLSKTTQAQTAGSILPITLDLLFAETFFFVALQQHFSTIWHADVSQQLCAICSCQKVGLHIW